MKIISFAWTTKALLEGKKTVTRRRWKKQLVKEGELVQAYDRQPRFKGKRVAIIKILDVQQILLRDITDKEEKKEGGLWGNAQNFINAWLETYPDSLQHDLIWRIEFELIRKVK